MGIISDLIKDLQNRPRIFDFRSQTTALQGPTGYEPTTAKTSKVSTTEQPAAPYHNPRGNLPTNEIPEGAVAVGREIGQYPVIHPEFENISSPYEWHQALVAQNMADAKAQIDQRRSQSVYNISHEYGSEPARSNSEPSQLPSNVYNRNVSFR